MLATAPNSVGSLVKHSLEILIIWKQLLMIDSMLFTIRVVDQVLS